MMADLNNAIQLIRAGHKQEAQRILELLLKADPANIQAWFWYVETYPNLEKRIQVLEMCLKMNPGNAQVLQALQTLNKQRPAPSPSVPAASSSSSQPFNSSSYDYDQKLSNTASSSMPYADEEPMYAPVVTTPPQQPQGISKKAWEETSAYVDNSTLSKPKSAARSYSFYDVWLTVLTSLDIDSYKEILKDPEASAGRGFEWMAYAGIVSGLIAPLAILGNPTFTELKKLPEFESTFGNMGMTALLIFLAFALALITPIISVIGLAFNAGVQNVLAVFFGGNGYYGRTVYALAAYQAPVTIVIGLLGIIPLVGQCLISLLMFYNLVLNVRALRAAHSISTIQALGVIFAPTVILGIFFCLVIFVAMPDLLSS
jgi:hypothetical protein